MKRFQWIALCLVSLIFALWLGSCSSPPLQVVTLNFVSAGMVRNAILEIDQLYQQDHPNVFLNKTFAGSDLIKAAIEQGEPFDGVLLAEIPPLDALQAQGLILPESRKQLVSTDIVVIAPQDSPLQLSDFRELTSDRFKTVAMGSNSVAVGKYTHAILTRLGIDQAVESKAVLTKADVEEILIAVEAREATVGITFLSQARTSAKVKLLATASPDLYEPIRSAAAVVKTSAHPQEMQTFLDFLSSDQAKPVFEKFGLRPLIS